MRILYGVQATGNGHISRARALVEPLAQAGHQVDFLFSGRPQAQLFAMEPFGRYRWARGLSFATRAGRVQWWQSAKHLALSQFWQDSQQLDTRSYDLVLTDFEPVVAWAARRQGTPSIAIGHQYAFLQDIPTAGLSLAHRALFRYFAPADHHIGLHWDRFDCELAPPLLHFTADNHRLESNAVLVYLPFEDLDAIIGWCQPLTDYQFYIFHPACQAPCQQSRHLTVYPPDLQQFKAHFERSEAVLCNAGFELVSEALQAGKRIGVKPLQGQIEQTSNALALTTLQLASCINQLGSLAIAEWLATYQPRQRRQFPLIAHQIPTLLERILQRGAVTPLQSLWQTPAPVPTMPSPH